MRLPIVNTMKDRTACERAKAPTRRKLSVFEK